MDKVFLAHPHGDHMNDLTHIYWIGPSMDRKSPQFVWGPGPSGVKSPRPPRRLYDDGTRAMCAHLREALRWATESFSFQTTGYAGYDTPAREGWVVPDKRGPVSDDPPTDAYALIPIELDWRKYGQREGDNVAYRNPTTGVTITHFPVIHTRKGSMGYRLEWNGLSMVYTSDTKPEHHSITQGSGVDVFVHEMILPADYLTMKTMHLTSVGQVPEWALDAAITVQNSSHTPQGAYGYLLSEREIPPRLAVATHFTVSDDTVGLAKSSVLRHVPYITCNPPHGEILDGGIDPEPGHGTITWSTDLMVLRVFPNRILIQRGVVSDYTYQPFPGRSGPTRTPEVRRRQPQHAVRGPVRADRHEGGDPSGTRHLPRRRVLIAPVAYRHLRGRQARPPVHARGASMPAPPSHAGLSGRAGTSRGPCWFRGSPAV